MSGRGVRRALEGVLGGDDAAASVEPTVTVLDRAVEVGGRVSLRLRLSSPAGAIEGYAVVLRAGGRAVVEGARLPEARRLPVVEVDVDLPAPTVACDGELEVQLRFAGDRVQTVTLPLEVR